MIKVNHKLTESVDERSHNMKKSINESVVSVVIDEDKLEKAMKKHNYDSDAYFEFLYDIYGLEDGEDFQAGNTGLDLLFYSDSPKVKKLRKELGESMIKVGKAVNESVKLNEALKPAKVGWYGNSDPKLPDGSPELAGENSAISVNVIKGDNPKEDYAVVALMGDNGEHLLQLDKLKDKNSAIKLAEKLLKEVKDPMYDAKKVAKKYGMDYFEQ